MEFDNATIEYKIKILKGKYKGQTVTITVDLDDLECNDISGILIEKGYIEYSLNHEEHDVISRRILKTKQAD